MATPNANKIAKVDSSQPLLHQHGHEIQQYGSLVNPPIALSSDARSESCTLVNQILADTIIFYHLYKKHHWMMRGHTFYQLHLLLDKHAGEQIELIDALGERVQTLGGVALARAGACPPSQTRVMWQKLLKLSVLPTASKKYL